MSGPWDNYTAPMTTPDSPESGSKPSTAKGPWDNYASAEPTAETKPATAKSKGPWDKYATEDKAAEQPTALTETEQRYALTHPEAGGLPAGATKPTIDTRTMEDKAKDFVKGRVQHFKQSYNEDQGSVPKYVAEVATEQGEGVLKNLAQISAPGIATSIIKKQAPSVAAHLPKVMTENATPVEQLPGQIVANYTLGGGIEGLPGMEGEPVAIERPKATEVPAQTAEETTIATPTRRATDTGMVSRLGTAAKDAAVDYAKSKIPGKDIYTAGKKIVSAVRGEEIPTVDQFEGRFTMDKQGNRVYEAGQAKLPNGDVVWIDKHGNMSPSRRVGETAPTGTTPVLKGSFNPAYESAMGRGTWTETPTEDITAKSTEELQNEADQANYKLANEDTTGKGFSKSGTSPPEKPGFGRIGRTYAAPTAEPLPEVKPPTEQPATEFKAPAEKTAQPTQEFAREPGFMSAGEEGREPAKSAEEYNPAVKQKVSELSDANLSKLAKAHDLDPDKYDFSKRDAHRHRVERDKLVKDITERIGEDEKINIGRTAEAAEKEPGFASRDKSAKANAERAAKMFPRLRGPVDEFGNPTVRGGAPEAPPQPGLGRIAQDYLIELQRKGATVPEIEAAIPEAGNTVREVQNIAKRYGVDLRNKGFEQPTNVQYAGLGNLGERSAIRTGGASELIPQTSANAPATSAELNDLSNRELIRHESSNRPPTKEQTDIDALAKVRERLGLPHTGSKIAAPETIGTQKPVLKGAEVERLNARANAKYNYAEKPIGTSVKHEVTATDPKGNMLSVVSALEDTSEPGVWTVRGSASDRPGLEVGYEAYSRLLRKAEAIADATGKPVTVRSDPDMLSESAAKTWRKLQQREFKGIKWTGKGSEARASITFEPRKPAASATLPRAMGGPAPATEPTTFMGMMREHLPKQ